MKGKNMAVKKLRLMYERETKKVSHPTGDPMKAKVDQTFNEDSKIHSMLEKFARGEIHPRQPFYADVSQFTDFRDAQQRILYLTKEFMKLPAQVRALADNNPANIGDVLNDKRNTEFLRQHGVFEQLAKPGDVPPIGGTPPPKEETSSKT